VAPVTKASIGNQSIAGWGYGVEAHHFRGIDRLLLMRRMKRTL